MQNDSTYLLDWDDDELMFLLHRRRLVVRMPQEGLPEPITCIRLW